MRLSAKIGELLYRRAPRYTGAEGVMLVGGEDVDSRIELMERLQPQYPVSALGSRPALAERFAERGFRYWSYPLARRVNPVADLRAVLGLVRLFRRRRPRIVHAFDTKPCVLARLAARAAGVPIVVGTLPGLGVLYGERSLLTTLVRAVYEPLQTLTSHLAERSVFQHHGDLKELSRRGVVPAERSLIIPGSGIDTDRFSRSAVTEQEVARLRTELGIAAGEVVVTMVARVFRSKGVLEFAAAASRVRDQTRERLPGVRFLLVGGDDRDSADRLTAVELAGVQEQVTWLGERSDVLQVLALSDIFVLPSYYREGIPRVLLEAASMGLPLVAAESVGLTEVVKDGDTGLVVPPRQVPELAEAIVRLVQDGDLRRRCGSAARAHVVSRFELSLIAWQTITLYRQLERELAGSSAQNGSQSGGGRQGPI